MNDPGKLLKAAAGVLVLAALIGAGGCASSGGGHFCHEYAFEGYAAWPCFGYHPTCWQPWPGECLPCPSPFLPLEDGKSELVPLPDEPPMPLPTPELPVPQTEPAPAPVVPPAQPPPEEGAAGDGLSSRRTAENQAQYLQSLRWAPTDNR